MILPRQDAATTQLAGNQPNTVGTGTNIGSLSGASSAFLSSAPSSSSTASSLPSPTTLELIYVQLDASLQPTRASSSSSAPNATNSSSNFAPDASGLTPPDAATAVCIAVGSLVILFGLAYAYLRARRLAREQDLATFDVQEAFVAGEGGRRWRAPNERLWKRQLRQELDRDMKEFRKQQLRQEIRDQAMSGFAVRGMAVERSPRVDG